MAQPTPSTSSGGDVYNLITNPDGTFTLQRVMPPGPPPAGNAPAVMLQPPPVSGVTTNASSTPAGASVGGLPTSVGGVTNNASSTPVGASTSRLPSPAGGVAIVNTPTPVGGVPNINMPTPVGGAPNVPIGAPNVNIYGSMPGSSGPSNTITMPTNTQLTVPFVAAAVQNALLANTVPQLPTSAPSTSTTVPTHNIFTSPLTPLQYASNPGQNLSPDVLAAIQKNATYRMPLLQA